MPSRISLIAFLVVILTGCAVPARVSTPLPIDLKVTPPDSTVTKDIAALSGTWVGWWQEQLAHTLVVEKIEGSSASIVYSWGAQPDWGINTPGFSRVKGTVSSEGVLRAKLRNGADVVYKLAPDQKTLSGQYTEVGGRVTLGDFRRPGP